MLPFVLQCSHLRAQIVLEVAEDQVVGADVDVLHKQREAQNPEVVVEVVVVVPEGMHVQQEKGMAAKLDDQELVGQ